MSYGKPDQLVLLSVPLVSVDEASAAIRQGALPADLLWLAMAVIGETDPRGMSSTTRDELLVRYLNWQTSQARAVVHAVAPVAVSKQRALELAHRSQQQARLRISQSVLNVLRQRVPLRAEVGAWRLRRNPTLRKIGSHYVFLSWNKGHGDAVKVRASRPIDAVLAMGGEMSVSGGDLIAVLAPLAGETPVEALHAFVARLVDRELLIPADEAAAAHTNPAEDVCRALRAVGDDPGAAALAALASVSDQARTLTGRFMQDLDAAWEGAAEALPGLAEIPAPDRFTIDVDLAAMAPSVDRASIRAVANAAARVAALQTARNPAEGFTAEFRSRYGDAAVPLLELADPLHGLISMPRQPAPRSDGQVTEPEATAQVPHAAATALQALAGWLQSGEAYDIESVSPVRSRAPRWVRAALLEKFEGKYSALLLTSYQHLPESVAARFRVGPEAEHADGSAPSPAHIAASVTPTGEVHMWDISAGQRHISQPELLGRGAGSGAPLLRAAVDTIIDRTAIGWTWGTLSALPHLPRVVCGEVIVSPERWRLSRASVNAVRTAGNPAATLRKQLAGLGPRRWLGLELGLWPGPEGQGLLVVDTTSDMCVRTGLAALSGQEAMAWVELPQLESPPVRGQGGRHAAEILALLEPAAEEALAPRPRYTPDLPQGRQWVCFSYRCSPMVSDEVACLACACADRLGAEQRVCQWFFERTDGKDHFVRLLCEPADATARSRIVAALDQSGSEMAAAGLVSRVAMDHVPAMGHYYAGQSVTDSAPLYFADSADVCSFLCTNPDEGERLYRCARDALAWSAAASSAPGDQMSFLRYARAAAGRHFPGRRGGEISAFIDSRWPEFTACLADAPPMDERLSGELRGHVRAITAPPGGRGDWRPLAASFRLHCDRLFPADSRWWELAALEMASRITHERISVKPEKEEISSTTTASG